MEKTEKDFMPLVHKFLKTCIGKGCVEKQFIFCIKFSKIKPENQRKLAII